jgi:hypothetical protein
LAVKRDCSSGEVDRIVPVRKAQERDAMLAGVGPGEVQGAFNVIQHGSGLKRFSILILFIIRDVLFEEGCVPSLLDVCRYTENAPKMVIAVVMRAVFTFQ